MVDVAELVDKRDLRMVDITAASLLLQSGITGVGLSQSFFGDTAPRRKISAHAPYMLQASLL